MDAAALRALQAPLKERYRKEPETARIRAFAEGTLAADEPICTIGTWAGPMQAGLHPAAGGDGTKACSADLLLEALVACAGVTLKSVAIAMGVRLNTVRLSAEGFWDARGTLGLARDVPVGLTEITLTVAIDSDADDKTLTRLLQLTERYCVIFQTLSHPPKMSLSHQRIAPR